MQSNRKGFTLIELLIVVVIIGILAAIAIPKFANTKEKAYLATMKSDLRNLATAQEAYASDNNGDYIPAGTATVGVGAWNGYAPSSGVTVEILAPEAGAWGATATHSAVSTKTCGIYVGAFAAPPGNTKAEGEPSCWDN